MGKKVIRIEQYECDFCGERIGGKPIAFQPNEREFFICDECKGRLKTFLKENP